MLVDDNQAVRKLAVERIVKAKKAFLKSKSSRVRKFKKVKAHQLNLEATQYYDIINWNNVKGC